MAHNCGAPEICHECSPYDPEPIPEPATTTQPPQSIWQLPIAEWAWKGDAADLGA